MPETVFGFIANAAFENSGTISCAEKKPSSPPFTAVVVSSEFSFATLANCDGSFFTSARTFSALAFLAAISASTFFLISSFESPAFSLFEVIISSIS